VLQKILAKFFRVSACEGGGEVDVVKREFIFMEV
jgi:hypothetical protein